CARLPGANAGSYYYSFFDYW
nr:immunoglobulin heavy chain junction region [Macaca mulatta]